MSLSTSQLQSVRTLLGSAVSKGGKASDPHRGSYQLRWIIKHPYLDK